MKLNFKNQGGAIIFYVNVIGREESEGWLKAMVNFNESGFSANFKISLMLNDLHAFIDQLKSFQKFLTGEVIFSNIENNVEIKLSTDGLGHVAINGMLRHSFNPDLKILFVINSDQTFLPELISECNQILEHYQPN